MSDKAAFICRMCGQCCEGRGGIIVSRLDEERLCLGLHLDREVLQDRYMEFSNGKKRLRTSPDGHCLFFRKGRGCSIHPFKPSICRAWPYFRGNMVDSVSFFLAKEYCPGISTHVTHNDFVAEGIRYIERYELFSDNDERAGTALFTRDQLKSLACSILSPSGENGKKA